MTLVSSRADAFASFKGPLFQYRVFKSINREKSEERFWTVFSQGKRSVLVRYLWGKLLWDELNKLESTIFWHLSEITNDPIIYLSLAALNNGVNKKLLRKRLENNPFNLKFVSRQQYLSIKSQVNFFFKEETVTLRPTTKFSGWVKQHNDKGSLGPEREENFSTFLDPISDVKFEIILKYLTVGEIDFLQGDVVVRPEDAKKQKRSPLTKKK